MFDDAPVPLGGNQPTELEAGNLAPPFGARSRALNDMPEGQPNQSAQVARLLSAVLRYKWLVLVCAIFGAMAGFVLRRFTKPVYRAEATVWIQSVSESEAQRGPIRSDNLFEPSGWVELLRSFAVLDNVVLQRRLFISAEGPDRRLMSNFALSDRFRPGGYRLVTDKTGKKYELQDQTGVVLETGTVGDSVGRELGFQWAPQVPADRTVNFSVTTPREAALKLNERLVVEMRQTSRQEQNFIRLQLDGRDPGSVSAVLNAVADRFVQVGADLKKAQLNELVGILETQRMYAEKSLRDAEIALEAFRVGTITLPSDKGSPVAPGLESTRDPVMENFFEMKIQREQLRRDAEGVQQALGSGNAAQAADALASIPTVTQSPELAAALAELTTKRSQLRALRQQYTEEHPTVQRLMQDIATHEREVIPRLGNNLLTQIGSRGAILDTWINSASSDLQQIPPRMIEEARLRRQVEIAQRLHTNLRERFEEARLASATTIPDVRVLDRATAPNRPITSRGLKLIILGLGGGIALGLALAILIDRFDPRLRYPDQVTRQLGLPILGALPRVNRDNDRDNSTLQAIEALREIRLNLAHSVDGQQPLVLAVTSPGSGDGKTFVTCNLAIACTGAGQRTLLIDGDTRRGELHRLLNASRQPGLTDYLRGDVPLASIVQSTEHVGLDFIGCGTRREASPNLLGTSAMQKLLTTAMAKYNVVLIDCPPLAAGVDPYVIGTMVGNVMLVLRTGRTDRALTEAKLQVLDRLPVRLVGAVLNDVAAAGVYRYYSYLSGYEPPPDELEIDKQLQGV